VVFWSYEFCTGATHGHRTSLWQIVGPSRARLGKLSGAPLPTALRAIYDLLGISEGTRLLDVGCGPGGASLLAAERGAHVSGLDASPDSINVARERVEEGDFRVGDMEGLPWPDGSFDAVTGFNSFQFAGNPVAALKEARRVLVGNGKVGVVVFSPPEKSQQTTIMAAVGALAPSQSPDLPGPFALSAPGALVSALKAAILRPIDDGDFPIVLSFPTAEAACKAFLAGAGSALAIQHSGEERVRQAIRDVLAGFQMETGEYRIENHFRFVIAT
jgi:SAM-dependent methyltransferase